MQNIVTNKKKIAVILFNLGGPNPKTDVKQFLLNLFNDRAVLNYAQPWRWLIAKLIVFFRLSSAKANYDLLGGHSPLLVNTELQAKNLKDCLSQTNTSLLEFEIFICMRYSYPNVNDTMQSLIDFNPDTIVLLPLYPQYSTTTTASSIKNFFQFLPKKLKKITETICCYYNNNLYIKSYANIINSACENLDFKNSILIFSAHGLPQKIIDAGDPYQWQVEQTVKEIRKYINSDFSNIIISYQSRVGPIEWIKPYTDEIIISEAKKKLNIVVVPIAFVSEHLETLVELDIEYKELALANGAKSYLRIKTPSIDKSFIESLAQLVNDKISLKQNCTMNRKCDESFSKCYYNQQP